MRHDQKIRLLNCCNCWIEGQTQYAHIRKHSQAGIAYKPKDNRTVPLCVSCHASQHNQGELSFWGRDLSHAIEYAESLYGKDIELMKILTWRFYRDFRS